MTIREVRAKAIKQIKSQTPQLDVDVLLQFILKRNRSWLLSHDDEQITNENLFWALVEKRKTGVPIAYLTHSKEFYGYDFYVTPDVLIPKPDTELLVELACQTIKDKKKLPLIMADICTGSGCVAISVIKSFCKTANKAKFDCYCTDISKAALAVAKINAENLLNTVEILSGTDTSKKDSKIHFLQGDLCEPIAQKKFDLIVSNPPYVPSTLTDKMLQDGRSEPRIALNGDINSSTDGMGIIRKLVPQAYSILNKNGVFLIETGEYNADATAVLFEQNGFSQVQTVCDLSGQKRVTRGIKASE
ncbi:MAG: protein-(glutamine-N5) methyltransferase, release factor-specific [Treponema sp. CETP13]|nr:MAG: protein-(glutamine-N5) methyltransferase, release factor-specific [Treponema sp. CETP13]